jgi:acyl-CoA synthetase (AMP-forming)/AMP-acid ligase II/aryl carrier-like protein
LIRRTCNDLEKHGIERTDRIAVVLPNGPEMAVIFLGVASIAVFAPLNPAYRRREFEFYFNNLEAKALITLAGEDSEAVPVALDRGIPVIRLHPDTTAPAGTLRLARDSLGDSSSPGSAESLQGMSHPDDTTLLLHTSGTTSRPKMVPLTHRNLSRSALNIARTLELSEDDCSLTVMPLFHIHALVSSILATLAAGGRVVLTPGFYAPEFFDWVEQFRPSWYTAAPTIHKAVLSRATTNPQVIANHPFRFIRVGAAALPPKLMMEIEEVFQVPVLEFLGMTEAAQQITHNPLPPGRRKPGSVGLPAGPEVAIMSETGEILAQGETGEIVIRGENVMPGYDRNPEVNAITRSNGWFRTGDEGYFDEEGYLYVTGRLKEMINRSGEKVSPREVDEVLLEHPAIEQATTFAVRHSRLGEDVGAAVVVRRGMPLTESEVRHFVAARLADFKVPGIVRIVSEIPKGPTGKLKRIGLAEALGVEPIGERTEASKAEYDAPRTPLERRLCDIWRSVLRVRQIGVQDDFFYLGGDSVLATEVLARVARSENVQLPLLDFVEQPTISAASVRLEKAQKENRAECRRWLGLIPIQASGDKAPLFCAPGHDANLFLYPHMARHLQRDRPIVGFPPVYTDERWRIRPVEEVAARNIRLMRACRPHGPYHLAGYCFGGSVVYEMACQLKEQGEQVGLLALLATPNHAWKQSLPRSGRIGQKSRHFWRRLSSHFRNLVARNPKDILIYLRGRLRAFLRDSVAQAAFEKWIRSGWPLPGFFKDERYFNRSAMDHWIPKPYVGSAVLFRDQVLQAGVYPAPQMGWSGFIQGSVELHDLPEFRGFGWNQTKSRFVAERLKDILANGV